MTKVTRKIRGPINGTIAGVPSDRKPPPGAVLAHWVIYQKPKDYPDGYVLRATYIMEGGSLQVDPIAWYASDPAELRKIVPPGLIKFVRAPDDDPVIMESWI